MKTGQLLVVVMLIFIFTSIVFADGSRYTVSDPFGGEFIVTDTVTGLIWQKSYATYKMRQQALSYCENLNYAGETDWRLPNIQELSSLVNSAKYNPASDFPDMPSNYFWSSSSYAPSAYYAWYVDFGYGFVYYQSNGSDYAARCVRSGP